MINVLAVLLLVMLFAYAIIYTLRKSRQGGGCCGEREQTEERIKVSDRRKAHYPYEIELSIAGMACENCAVKVENALNKLDGTWARVDIGTHRARIRCKNPPDEQQLRQAIIDAGYVPL